MTSNENEDQRTDLEKETDLSAADNDRSAFPYAQDTAHGPGDQVGDVVYCKCGRGDLGHEGPTAYRPLEQPITATIAATGLTVEITPSNENSPGDEPGYPRLSTQVVGNLIYDEGPLYVTKPGEAPGPRVFRAEDGTVHLGGGFPAPGEPFGVKEVGGMSELHLDPGPLPSTLEFPKVSAAEGLAKKVEAFFATLRLKANTVPDVFTRFDGQWVSGPYRKAYRDILDLPEAKALQEAISYDEVGRDERRGTRRSLELNEEFVNGWASALGSLRPDQFARAIDPAAWDLYASMAEAGLGNNEGGAEFMERLLAPSQDASKRVVEQLRKAMGAVTKTTAFTVGDNVSITVKATLDDRVHVRLMVGDDVVLDRDCERR